jgi:hypothetical protein
MRGYIIIAVATLGMICGTPAAFANGAKPDNPSAWGQLISGQAGPGFGAVVSQEAKSPSLGTTNLGTEVQELHSLDGSAPNLPPTHP